MKNMNQETSECSASFSEEDFKSFTEKLKLARLESNYQIDILSKKSGLMIFLISRKLHAGMSWNMQVCQSTYYTHPVPTCRNPLRLTSL